MLSHKNNLSALSWWLTYITFNIFAYEHRFVCRMPKVYHTLCLSWHQNFLMPISDICHKLSGDSQVTSDLAWFTLTQGIHSSLHYKTCTRIRDNLSTGSCHIEHVHTSHKEPITQETGIQWWMYLSQMSSERFGVYISQKLPFDKERNNVRFPCTPSRGCSNADLSTGLDRLWMVH